MPTAAQKNKTHKDAKTKKATPKKQQTVDDVLISIVLDRSGSMEIVRDATIEGFNAFMKQQAGETEGGNARVSLVQFDTEYEPNFFGEPIDNVPELSRESYIPRGGTALNDAVANTIRGTERWLDENGSDDRVLLCIITDGDENSSEEFNLYNKGTERLAEIIKAKEEAGWTFVFIGANLDAFAKSQELNIPTTNAMEYTSTPQSAGATFAAVSTATSDYRTSGARASTNFTQPVANTADVKTAYDDEQTSASGTLKPKTTDTSNNS